MPNSEAGESVLYKICEVENQKVRQSQWNIRKIMVMYAGILIRDC